MTLTLSDPAALGFDADRLARIPAMLDERYIQSGKLPHAALLIGRGDEVAQLSLLGEARAGQPLGEDAI
ncbi:MAG: serine hydrolase, partial [Sphingomonas sp.]